MTVVVVVLGNESLGWVSRLYIKGVSRICIKGVSRPESG